jgi:hypothetical protein
MNHTYMLKSIVFYLLFFSTALFSAQNTYNWLLWCHANGDNSLADFIDYNAQEMATAAINNNILVLMEADRPVDVGTFRYRVEQGKVTLVQHLSHEMGLQPGKEIVDGIKWAKSNYSFTHLILDLWGHGSGIMDPSRVLKTRGILFDDTNNTYLNNQDLANVTDQIAGLMGKKIEMLGTDACLMAGIEVGWQIKKSVSRLIASETTEPGTGWLYSPFLNAIASNKNISANEVAASIVKAYGSFYKRGAEPYTLSAMDLTMLDSIVQNLHLVIDKIKICMKQDARNILVSIMTARALSLQMDDSSYIDLWSFLDNLYKQFDRMKIRAFDGAHDLNTLYDVKEIDILLPDARNLFSDLVAYFPDEELTRTFKTDVDELKRAVANCKAAVDRAIIANQAGNAMKGAHGMSIYFPPARYPIHPSYPLSKFAQETRWLNDFLIKIMGYQLS